MQRRFSFLARAVVAGVRQAWHVEFDRIAAFVASGGKETTNNAGQGQNDTAHGLLPVGFCLAREKLHICGSHSCQRCIERIIQRISVNGLEEPPESLAAISLALASGSSDCAPSIVARIFAINTAAFTALFLVHRLGVFAGLAQEPHLPARERNA